MMMRPLLSKIMLTAHIIVSVGWLGAVAAFLALAIVGLSSADREMVRAAYLAMDSTTTAVIVPSCLLALVSGILQALGSRWGLFRHYWVLTKLLITLAATLILFLHTRAISEMARAAAQAALSSGDLRPLRVQLVADSGAALVTLGLATALAVLKPLGMTRYGWRKKPGA